MKAPLCFTLLAAAAIVSAGSPPEFFVFDNGVGRGSWTPEQQASTLKRLGYDGISYNYTSPADLAVWLKTFQAHGLKIYGLYVGTFVDRPERYDPPFQEAIRLLKGSDTVIWMTLRAANIKTNHDAAAVSVIRDLADQARANGLRVVLYPHAGFYAATAADALRLARLADRPNVSASLNLCHEFLSGNANRLEAAITNTARHLALISINGVDVKNKNYIVRLDQGDFDVAAFLKKMRAAGYQGPVGLQCYNVKGDVAANLEANLAAWRKLAE